MKIAVNTRFLLKDGLEGYGYFIKEVFSRMASAHPEHQFFFLFDRPFDPGYITSPNITPLVISPPARHPLLWKWWYDYRVPPVLRRIGADIFVSPDGFCSLRTRVPQCLVIHDLAIIHYPSAFKKSHAQYIKRNIRHFLRKAGVIATVSEFSKQDMISAYAVENDRIRVVYSAARDIFRPLPAEEQLRVKEQYAGGREYFLYVGAIQPRKNVISLLKAFSLFKKRQQSEMKLVLVGRLAWKNDEFLKLMKSYKYRSDVIMTGYLEEGELVRLTASAWATVYPSFFEGFGVPVLEGMKCGVPVLTSAGTSMEEIAGDAGLYFDPHDPASIAEQMMRIYKDEQLRKTLVVKGLETATRFSWDRTAALLWESMLEAAKVDGG